MGVTYLTVLPHWRDAVGDVIETLEASSDGAVRITSLARAARRSRVDPSAPVVAVGSDTTAWPRRLRLITRHRRVPVFRLWWNGADEIAGYLGAQSGQAGSHTRIAEETHVCFFSEIAPQLVAFDARLLHVPYAFSRPMPAPRPATSNCVSFTSEVDTSDECFAGSADTRALSDIAWHLAHQVVAGEQTMLAADAEVHAATSPGVARTTLWAVRNRVRFLLVQAIVSAFPGRVLLRGSDWQRLGFEAEKTAFRRGALLSGYESHRVSLDLGSKSTHANLYPRSADILSRAGGLVQFDTGDASLRLPDVWRARQSRTSDGMLAVIDRLLGMSPSEAQAENLEVHQHYRALRLDAGHRLLAAIIDRATEEGP